MGIPPIRTLPSLGSSDLHFGQAVNGTSETRQCCTVKDEVDADRYPDEVGAGFRPTGQQLDAENDSD
jgi:hypothetical protein